MNKWNLLREYKRKIESAKYHAKFGDECQLRYFLEDALEDCLKLGVKNNNFVEEKVWGKLEPKEISFGTDSYRGQYSFCGEDTLFAHTLSDSN